MRYYDIAIVGAGFAGLNMAHCISGQDIKVAVIEKRKTYPNIFRAEKIEAPQAAIMRELGTLQFRTPHTPPLGKTINISGGEVFEVDTVEQYGISYSSTVNTLRQNLPSTVEMINQTVSKVIPGDSGTLLLDSGEELSAKLIVLACGLNAELIDALKIERKEHTDLVSLSFGFDIKREDGADFEFGGINYFLPDQLEKVQYITVFPIGNRMRVNLFTQLSRSDELAQALRNDTLNTVDKLFPNLYDHLGKIVLDSRVQVMPTTYYKLVSQSTPGVVVIGDSFQSVSPATGSGLSKVLTDVKTLSKSYIPQWKNQRKISVDDIASYYKNQQKTVIDRRSLKSWFYSDYGSLERMPILGRIKRFLQLYFRHGARG